MQEKRIELILEWYRLLCPSLKPLPKEPFKQEWRTLLERGAQYFEMVDYYEAFWLAQRSSFLKGGGRRGWKADFQWLITPENMHKVLTERYAPPLSALERKANRQSFRMICEAYEEQQGLPPMERRGTWGKLPGSKLM